MLFFCLLTIKTLISSKDLDDDDDDGDDDGDDEKYQNAKCELFNHKNNCHNAQNNCIPELLNCSIKNAKVL